MPYRWSPWPKQSEHGYESMSTKGEKDNDDTEIPRELPLSLSPKPSLLARRGWLFPWVMCIFLSAALIVVTPDHRHAHHQSSYEMGFDTDLAPANPALRLTKVKFYGGLQVDANGTWYLTHNPEEPKYVGPSSPEIDANWDRMSNNERFVGLTPEEAAETDFEIDDKDWVLDRYWVYPNTFHTLHCLNYIRKSLDREYYTEIQDLPKRPFRISHRMHLDHCLEALRQTVQCSLDMTPVPRPWVPEAGIYHADIDQWHTCRDFSAVRNWMKWRMRGQKLSDFNNATSRYRDKNAPYAKWEPWGFNN